MRWAGREREFGPNNLQPSTVCASHPQVSHPSLGDTVNTRTRLAAAIAAAAAFTLTACGASGSTVTDKPKTSSSKHAATQSPAAPKVATVGDTISLKGVEGGKLDVTVVKVADNAKSSEEGFVPDAGKRWLGVQFRLVNTGSTAYSDSPGNGAQLVDTQGQQFGTVFADITAGPSMSSDVNLKPGAKALGWIVFELPKASKAATVQFAMDSGFSDQTGEWKLS